jgi:PAS domain S-box-containing protein
MAENPKTDTMEALRRSEERFGAFIRNSSEAIWLFELDDPVPTAWPPAEQIDAIYRGAYLADCNEAMARLYGFQRAEEVIGIRLGELMPREDPANLAYLHAFIAAGYQLNDAESVERTKDGKTKYLLNSLHAAVKNGTILRAWGTSRDITPIREAEERLRESEGRFRLIFESATDFAILTTDIENRITSWNVGAGKMFGYHPDDILGRSAEILFIPEDRAKGDPQKETKTAAEKGRAPNERWHLKKSGERFWGSGYMMPMRNAQGSVSGFLKIMRDNTAAREAEELRRRHMEEIERLNDTLEQRVQRRTAALSEANGHLRAFAHTVAHDLRAPFRSVREFSGILMADYAAQLPDEAKMMLQRIQAATDRMDLLLSAILDYSRTLSTDLKLEPISLDALVEEMLARQESQIRQRSAVVRIANALPTVVGHRALLAQALENLFTNALKFVPRHRQPEITIFSETTGGRARLGILDNGIGVATEDREKIFGLFERGHQQADYPGTGIGLAIVQAAVRRMGGSVGLVSQPGESSTFWIELPLSST